MPCRRRSYATSVETRCCLYSAYVLNFHLKRHSSTDRTCCNRVRNKFHAAFVSSLAYSIFNEVHFFSVFVTLPLYHQKIISIFSIIIPSSKAFKQSADQFTCRTTIMMRIDLRCASKFTRCVSVHTRRTPPLNRPLINR